MKILNKDKKERKNIVHDTLKGKYLFNNKITIGNGIGQVWIGGCRLKSWYYFCFFLSLHMGVWVRFKHVPHMNKYEKHAMWCKYQGVAA